MYSFEISKPAQDELAEAPVECSEALMAFLDAVVFDPWEFGAELIEPAFRSKPHRTLAFGNGRGLVSFLIHDPDDLVWVTQVVWLG